jgi:two-component system, NarL family, invasion response regulator UvrY
MLKILIADDHELVRHGLKQVMLEEDPFSHIEEVENGLALVARAKSTKWDIIIMDITMPLMNGLDALLEIRKSQPIIPVLMFSVHADDRYYADAYHGGASGYLSKAISENELIHTIRKILSGKKHFPDSFMLGKSLPRDAFNMSHSLLSKRELSVFKLIATGNSISEISGILSISASTISTYRSRIMVKMKMNSNAQITKYALEHQLI